MRYPYLFFVALCLLISPAMATAFTNGGFETGSFSPWTSSGLPAVVNYAWYIHSGSYGMSPNSNGDYIEQDITGAGTNVSYWCKSNGPGNYYSVYWKGSVVDNPACPASVWGQNFLTISGGDGILKFHGTQVGAGLALDDIVVSSAVTIPVSNFTASPTC